MSDCQCDMHGRGKACHCRLCCLSFSGPSAFDHHIVNGVHRDPASRGLVLRERAWGSVWGKPGERPHDEDSEQTEAVL